ncbi:hypothetical protein FRC01_013390 [Tulasnella sp. 417]|nr:hypothetical protein FRC01_013390 [Tulasnella sp. 417]
MSSAGNPPTSTSKPKEASIKFIAPLRLCPPTGSVPATPVVASPTISAPDPFSPAAEKQAFDFAPVFHQDINGPIHDNMMSISAMVGFRHMSHEELRVGDWNLDRQAPDWEDIGTDRLRNLSLGRAWEKGWPLPISAGASTGTARPSNKALAAPTLLGHGPRPPFASKGRESAVPNIAGPVNGNPPCKREDPIPAPNPFIDPGIGSRSTNASPFTAPVASTPSATPILRTGLDKPNQAKPTIGPSTPSAVPPVTVNPSLQNENTPKGFGFWSLTDSFRLPFVPSPAAERCPTVDAAEKVWADARRQAHEAKKLLAKAQAAYNQAALMERLKFNEYCHARRRFDE